MKNRARIRNLILVNWNGFFYQPFEMDGGVTALEGENGAGKTTVMIAAFVALLPDQRLLQFRNVADGGSIEGDRGIFGRLGAKGVSYTVLELLTPKEKRILAGVVLRKKAALSLELTPFIVEGLSRDLPLEEILLVRDGEMESVPELSDLRQKVGTLGASLKACESVGQYASNLFDLGVIPMRMEAYAERDRFNRMLQTSMYGGLSNSIQKGLRDYLLAEDPSLRNHVARMRENLEACRVTRQEIASADQKYKIIQGVFRSGYGMFEAAFHGTRLRVVGLRKNADASRSEHLRCKSELARVQRQRQDLERRYNEIKTELESKQRAYSEAQALYDRCKKASEIALEIERHESRHLAVQRELEETEASLRRQEQHFQECERKRDRLLSEKEQNAEGMADAQKAWEQVSRKVALYKQAKETLNDVQKTFPDREVSDQSAIELLSECRDQCDRALENKIRMERELGSLVERTRRYEHVLEALRELSETDFQPELALQTARELDREFRDMSRKVEEAESLPERIADAKNRAEHQQEVRRKVSLLTGRGEKIENAADLRSLFESRNKELESLAEEHRQLQERSAHLAEERVHAEQQINRLQDEAKEWRESRRLIRKLESSFAVSIVNGPALEELRTQIQEEQKDGGEKVKGLGERRDALQNKALDLEFSGGRLDEALVKLRDIVDGKLVAELYDEVTEQDAATVEARLGPLHGALLVEDIPTAVQRIMEQRDRPDDVWLMEAPLPRELPDGKSFPTAELANMGSAWRLTRHPERPVVGRAAREREIGRLKAEVDTLLEEIDVLRTDQARFQDGLKTLEVLSRYYRFLGMPDPAESANRLQDRLNEMKVKERPVRRRMEEIDHRSKYCREMLQALTFCLPDASLLDDSDWGEKLKVLQGFHKEAGVLKERMKSRQRAIERVRAGWLDLEYPPPGPEQIRACRQSLELAEASLNYWSRGKELLIMLVDRLPHFSYSDQERLFTEQASALDALKRKIKELDRAFQAAKAEVQGAQKELELTRKAYNDKDASYKALSEKIELLRQDLAGTGEDGTRESLDDAEKSRERAKKRLDTAQDAERKTYTEFIEGRKDVQIAENNTSAGRGKRKADLEALWPHWRNWMNLKRRAAHEGLLDRLMDPQVVHSYDQKGPPRAFEESFGQQGELKRILQSTPQGEGLWQEIERLGEIQNAETRRGSQTLDSWLMIRAFLEKSIPRDIAQADDPELALKQIEDHLSRLNERLLAQERQLQHHSDTIANSIRTRIRREERHIYRINKGLESISFGTISSIRIRLERVEAMQRLLDGLKMQRDLFESSMSLEEAMVELYRQVGGGQVRGDQLLDYREYVRMSVEVQRRGSEKWTKATSSVLSTGESIGVGAAVLMVILDAWEHQAILLRGKRDGGSIRFLFLDEAARLSPRSLDTLGELCERMDLQLLVAAPAADRARRGTAYRLVRRISEMGGEEVVVRGRRFTGRAAEVQLS